MTFFDVLSGSNLSEFHEFHRSKELLRRAQQHGLANAILDELDRERQELRCAVAETQSRLARAMWQQDPMGGGKDLLCCAMKPYDFWILTYSEIRYIITDIR